jgi:formylglycine-generating enzyme required for sulfatase activity
MALNLNPDARPARLIEYLRDRAGLLEPRGVGVYAFPHRTFQEYLAACHLTDTNFPDELAALLRAEPNRWREVVLLAGAKAARGTAAAPWTLAEALCFTDPPAQQADQEAGYWGALLAAQVLLENQSLGTIAERHRAKVERIRQWLTCTLAHGALLPVDRVQAGDVLARIGDPRFRAEAWYLPDEPLLGFVEIPAGAFRMGSSKRRDRLASDSEAPSHQLTLPRYYMARYPVTVTQFRAFVEASGHQPAAARSLQGLPHHPVVHVDWYDALRYCTWLTEYLRAWAETPQPLAALVRDQGWQVTLPSEAEWEKAARGTTGVIYPWGNRFEATRANTAETGIGETSAVGCFPTGASPYGLMDMSGNVWEWTRSLGEVTYPYKATDGRENLHAPANSSRVLRGGAFWLHHRDVRCASRLRNYARGFNYYVGFRVVLVAGVP